MNLESIISTTVKSSVHDGARNIHTGVISLVEIPLYRAAMESTRYNQSEAARVLGVSRGTLRKKLKTYFGDEFIGSRT